MCVVVSSSADTAARLSLTNKFCSVTRHCCSATLVTHCISSHNSGPAPTAMAEDNNEVPAQDKAPVDNTEQEKKEVAEMPPAYDETNPLTSEEPSVKITVSSDTKIDMGKEKEAFQGLSKEELMKYANDPFWVRLRWILFILFWFIWIAMLVASIVIIIYAPKCPSPEPKQWWQKNVMYKVSQGK